MQSALTEDVNQLKIQEASMLKENYKKVSK